MENIFGNFYKNKKVLITGHTGFKGSWLSIMLNYLGAEVYGYALEPPTDPSLYQLCKIDGFVHSKICDIRNYDDLYAFIKTAQPEIIFHMAAQALVRESYKNPVETYQTNVMGNVHLLEAIRTIPSVKSVVIITTDKCYENKEWYWGYRENEPLGGYDPYSSSKACSEIVTAAYRRSFFHPDSYHNHGVAIATARAGNVIGGGDWAADRLIPDFIRAITNREKIKIRSPKSIRPWQHVLEPLNGYLSLGNALYNNGTEFADAWNFGPNDEDAKNVEWIVKYMCDSWGDSASYEIDKNPQPHEAAYLKLDCSKAKYLLNWEPRWSVKTALDSILEFTHAYVKNEDLKSVCINQIKAYLNNK